MYFRDLCQNLLSSLLVTTFLGTIPAIGGTLTIEEGDLDRRVSPCDDFYQFACGGWIEKAEIPADRPEWSRGFASIHRENEELIHAALVDFAAANSAEPGEHKQLGDYFYACMDEKNISESALSAFQRRLASVEAIKDRRSIAIQVARFHLEGVTALFSFGSSQDAKNSSEQIGDADQGGLSLPDRDYYLATSGRFLKIRDALAAHIESMFRLLGETPAQAKADAEIVLAIETKLAKVSADKVARRDPDAMYHRLNRPGLERLTSYFDWATYFSTLGYPRLNDINVDVPEFFTGLNKILGETKLGDLKIYLRWHLLNNAASALDSRFVNEDFKFSGKTLTGQPELPPRWKRCVGSTLHAMGQPVGKVFIDKTFSAAAKNEAKAMIAAIEDTMGERLAKLEWMDDETRNQAIEKLRRLVNQIGYPDRWRDYSGLKISRSSYFANRQAVAIFHSRYYLDKIGKPVDRGDWEMPPSMVNAYYSADNNKMVFPAGILQNPFYQHGRPDALNFGGIGMVMGHELTHGFDDQGRKFDGNGNLRDWWSAKVNKEFEERAACLVDQYSAYVPIENVHVNGKLTLGENIADQGGIRLAFQAWAKQKHENSPVVAGFAPEQQFFIGYAQSWCTKQRPEMTRLRAATDPHSPPRFRVNGPLSNFEEFAKAFSCKEGMSMAPAKRCRIW